MEIQPDNLLSLNQPLNLLPEVKLEVEKLIASPQLMQYLIEKTIEVMIQNGVGITNSASGDFIRGVNRGTLSLLNALVEHIED